jgi:hypothetical protein
MSTPDDLGRNGTVEFGTADEEAIRAALETEGYFIAPKVVPEAAVTAMRETWLKACAGDVASAPVIWGPFLGEPNRLLFHRSETCCMYRSYDFLWNPPMDALTRDIGLQLNRLRNRIAEAGQLAGEIMESDRYGIYITTSYYPPGEGWMVEHEDETDGRRHWHFMLQMSFKGDSYTEGGLFIIDKHGNRVDVDARVSPGDVIFFDGACTHGVEPVGGGSGVGRLQMFSIPTFMETPQQNDRMLEEISITRFVKAKLRPLKRRLVGNRSSGAPY